MGESEGTAMARWARISVVAMPSKGEDIEERRRQLAELAELAATARPKPDIVIFPEFATVLGLPGGLEEHLELAEPIPGPTTEALGEVARRHGMYIVVGMPERAEDGLYNAACFIGRDGGVVGVYRKYQPTIGEMDAGIKPGTEVPVFELDFGRAGAAICFDMKFYEVGQAMARGGARLCCFCSMFAGGARLLNWARDFGMYVAGACPQRSYIADMGGMRMLAETGQEIVEVREGKVPPIATALVNMDRCQFHLDYNRDKLEAITKKYGCGVEVQIWRPEAHFTLASLMDDVTVEDIIEEFELEPWHEYLDRARRRREQALGE